MVPKRPQALRACVQNIGTLAYNLIGVFALSALAKEPPASQQRQNEEAAAYPRRELGPGARGVLPAPIEDERERS